MKNGLIDISNVVRQSLKHSVFWNNNGTNNLSKQLNIIGYKYLRPVSIIFQLMEACLL